MKNQKVIVILLASIVAATMARTISEDDADSSSDMKLERAPINDFFARLDHSCMNRTGTYEALAMVMAEINKAEDCREEKFSTSDFLADVQAKIARELLVRKYCAQYEESINCYKPLYAQLRKCHDEDEVQEMETKSNRSRAEVAKICRDNATMFYESYGPCMDRIVTISTDLDNYNRQQCDELAQLRHCFLQQSQATQNSSNVMKVFDSYYRWVVDNSPCETMIQRGELTDVDTI